MQLASQMVLMGFFVLLLSLALHVLRVHLSHGIILPFSDPFPNFYVPSFPVVFRRGEIGVFGDKSRQSIFSTTWWKVQGIYVPSFALLFEFKIEILKIE